MFRFIAVQRNRNIRLLEKIGEIIQTPKHKSNLKQGAERLENILYFQTLHYLLTGYFTVIR